MAQGMITFITLGVGGFLGNFLAGKVLEHYSVGNKVDYVRFWLFPLGVAAVATVLFALLFREPKSPSEMENKSAG
jgi:MFS family permease